MMIFIRNENVLNKFTSDFRFLIVPLLFPSPSIFVPVVKALKGLVELTSYDRLSPVDC